MNRSEQAVSLFNKLAQHYANKYMDVGLYAESLDLFCKLAPPQAKVLELACGPGNVTKYILQKRSDLKILGTDLAPNMLQIARECNPGAEFELRDCRDILSIDRSFDALMVAFCLPYLSKEDSLQLIGDASQILAPRGLLYISTMEGDYSSSRLERSSSGDEMYIYYHEAGYLCEGLETNGFEILHLEHKPYLLPEGKEVKDLIIVAAKRLG